MTHTKRTTIALIVSDIRYLLLCRANTFKFKRSASAGIEPDLLAAYYQIEVSVLANLKNVYV